MASGPAHFAEAERLLRLHADAVTDLLAGLNVTTDGDLPAGDPDVAEIVRQVNGAVLDGIAWMLDAAKAHALLAKAAATLTAFLGEHWLDENDLAREWAQVIV